MKTLLLGALLGGAATLAMACAPAAGPAPMVTPPPITAADGTVIPLPPHVDVGATDAQRDAYAGEVFDSEGVTRQLDAAREACAALDSGLPPVAYMMTLVSGGMDPTAAAAVTYVGTLAYCPVHRSAFDNLKAMTHGDPASNPTQPEPAPIEVDPRLSQPADEGSEESAEPASSSSDGEASDADTGGSDTSSSSDEPNETGTSGESQYEWGCEQGYITEGC